jgi:hypothetical protein
VQQASVMLQRDQQRAAVLAMLAYLAQDDPMIGVREPAQEALDADARRQQTPANPSVLAPPPANADTVDSF